MAELFRSIRRKVSVLLAAMLVLASTEIPASADVILLEDGKLPVETDAAAAVSGVSAELLENEDVSAYPTGGVLTDIHEAESVPADIISADTVAENMVSRAVYSAYASETRYGYSTLTAAQKAFYDKCMAAIGVFLDDQYDTKDYTAEAGAKESYPVITADFASSGLSFNEANAVFWCIRNDYPEYYWLYYGYSYTSTSIQLCIGSDYYTPAARSQTEQAIAATLQEYVQATAGITDEYEKLRVVHDKIITDIEYKYEAPNRPESALWAHSIAGAFDSHKGAVCEGYAKALQYVLNELGMETIYMTGLGNGASHAWNGVKIDGSYFYVDPTWDDAGEGNYDGIRYGYFCIPADLFEKEHKADSSALSGNSEGGWLYELPEMSDSSAYTYYTRYLSDLSNATGETAEQMLRNAGTACPGEYLHILASNASMNAVMQTILSIEGGSSISYTKNPLGVVFCRQADVYKTVINTPATAVHLDCETLTINRDEQDTATLTATVTANGGESDDLIRWSASSDCVSIKVSGNTLTITGKRNGTATITATALKGRVTAACTVTVEGSSESERVYTDFACTAVPSDEDLVIWVNGGNVKLASGERYNYKVKNLYTDVRASKITTVTNGKTRSKNGKLVVGVTLSNEPPVLDSRNKIVDAAAAEIASATVNQRTGLIKVTAKKKAGTVYVWVIDTGDEHSIAYTKLTVKDAPTKLNVNDKVCTDAERTSVKKLNLALGDSADVYIEPIANTRTKSIAEGGTYRIEYAKNSEKYINVVEKPGSLYGYTITATGLDSSKPGRTVNAKVSFICNENNKKITVNVVVSNPVRAISLQPSSGVSGNANGNAFTVTSSDTAALSATFKIILSTADDSFATTDKLKVYKIASPDAFSFNAKDKLQYTKPTGNAAKMSTKLSKDKDAITVTIPKKLAPDTTSYFLLVYNNKCTMTFSVTNSETAQ